MHEKNIMVTKIHTYLTLKNIVPYRLHVDGVIGMHYEEALWT